MNLGDYELEISQISQIVFPKLSELIISSNAFEIIKCKSLKKLRIIINNEEELRNVFKKYLNINKLDYLHIKLEQVLPGSLKKICEYIYKSKKSKNQLNVIFTNNYFDDAFTIAVDLRKSFNNISHFSQYIQYGYAFCVDFDSQMKKNITQILKCVKIFRNDILKYDPNVIMVTNSIKHLQNFETNMKYPYC